MLSILLRQLSPAANLSMMTRGVWLLTVLFLSSWQPRDRTKTSTSSMFQINSGNIYQCHHFAGSRAGNLRQTACQALFDQAHLGFMSRSPRQGKACACKVVTSTAPDMSKALLFSSLYWWWHKADTKLTTSEIKSACCQALLEGCWNQPTMPFLMTSRGRTPIRFKQNFSPGLPTIASVRPIKQLRQLKTSCQATCA